jgi:cytosine/adenosine deaminase-related metal-dependent hydrolase
MDREHQAACGLAARAPRALRARWVFPVSSPPIADGVVYLQQDRIVAVEEASSGPDAEDLGNVAILPGLINAHTHLDLSDLAQPLGAPGIAFCDWIRRVIAFRRGQRDALPNARRLRSAGEERSNFPSSLGLSESLRLGTTTLGDIVQPGWIGQSAALEQPLPAVTAFLELIAPTPARIPAALELAQRHLELAKKATAWQPGLSPHAPYSVHPGLLTKIAAMSAQHRVPLAMHLAESRAEMELLQTGGGPLRELLEELGAWCPTLIPAAARPLDYLRTLAAAHRVLVIHGNYLDDEEIALVAAHRATTSVVYCPRTHAFFGHAPYRLEEMRAAGANVALGTDSRASSPDLSVLAEMRAVARRHPAVAGDAILRMGTLAGARALGCESEVGTLEPGKSADLAIVALPDRDAANPHKLLLDSDLPVVAVWRLGAENVVSA